MSGKYLRGKLGLVGVYIYIYIYIYVRKISQWEIGSSGGVRLVGHTFITTFMKHIVLVRCAVPI